MSRVTRKAAAQFALIDRANPIVSSLGDVFGGFLPGRSTTPVRVKPKRQERINRKHYGPRTDVVGESLCDDILKYLAPTLEPYKGCTILDIHPGACLWSRKLHDFLKPTRHVLMEPEERYHDAFIKPLLEKPDSTYRHTSLPGLNSRQFVASFKKIIDDALLPPRPDLPMHDPRLSQLDTRFLVTGNLARRYTLGIPRKSIEVVYMSLQHMAWGSLTHDLFQQNGLVRMLWWIPDVLKGACIPERPGSITSFNVGLRMGVSLTEVAGVRTMSEQSDGSGSSGWFKRHSASPTPTILHQDSMSVVRERMQASGMVTPDGRAIIEAVDSDRKVQEKPGKSPVSIRYDTVKKLAIEVAKHEAYVKQTLDALESSESVQGDSAKVTQFYEPLLRLLEYPDCLEAVLEFAQIQRGLRFVRGTRTKKGVRSKWTSVQAKMSIWLDIWLRQISLEAHCKAIEEGRKDRRKERRKDVADLKAQIIALDQATRRRLEATINVKLIDHLDTMTQAFLAYFASPQLLTHHRRAYEPLKADKDDFWPRVDLSLIDMTPVGRDLSVPGIADRRIAALTAQQLIKYLFVYPGQPVHIVLDRIAPNAAKDLIPQIPSMTDPRKGGRLDPGLVKARMLSEQMIEELIKAWFEWPFKPESWELALATGEGKDLYSEETEEALTPEAVSEA